ncbi:MAG: hypothetical protein H0W84_01265 [Bacteroidetes bacterium]|nr:hypothetical protein [Bacteroidota bacterium]
MKEIKNTLIEQNRKKVCGRFKSNQLDEAPKHFLNFSFLNLPQHLSYTKTFVLALVIVFGASLFSCDTQKGEVVGKTKIDTASICGPQITDTLEKSTKMGDTINSIIITGEVESQESIKKGKIKKRTDTISKSEDTTFKIKVFVGEDPY